MPDAGGKIIVFSKAPVAGHVKTRLQPALTGEQCAELHSRLLAHCLACAIESGIGPVELHCDGDLQHPALNGFRRQYGIELLPQYGATLGERMYRAFVGGLQNSQFVILTGSDCPALDATHLQHAATMLATRQTPIVLTPAEDGGYVLLGLRNVYASLFEDIAWGEDCVLAQTRERLRQHNLHWRELPALWDVDRPADLQRLRAAWPHLIAGLC